MRGTATTFASYNPTFMDLVRRELRADYKEEDLTNAGLRIMTTLDPRIQALAERRLTEGLDELETQPQAQGRHRSTAQSWSPARRHPMSWPSSAGATRA